MRYGSHGLAPYSGEIITEAIVPSVEKRLAEEVERADTIHERSTGELRFAREI